MIYIDYNKRKISNFPSIEIKIDNEAGICRTK